MKKVQLVAHPVATGGQRARISYQASRTSSGPRAQGEAATVGYFAPSAERAVSYLSIHPQKGSLWGTKKDLTRWE